jgi:hypothetical protein
MRLRLRQARAYTGICETMNAEYALRLEAAEEIVAYKSICVPVDKDHGPRTGDLTEGFSF